MKYAIIDIGSNSVRLMLWANGTLYKKVCTTRLAEGLSLTGELCDTAIERTAQAVACFVSEGREQGAAVHAFATAAVRSSSNGALFCRRVKELCGVEVDVVSGEQEAMLGLSGALGERDGGMLDLGGASTEVCIREGRKIVCSVSLPIGSVRMIDKCGQDREQLDAFISSVLTPIEGVRPTGTMYAIGGTASTLAGIKLGLAAYDATKLNGLSLSRSWLEETASRLLAMSVEERKKVPGMDIRRADVIAGASLLLVRIMQKLGLEEVIFSDADNLEGYLTVRGLA